MFSFFVSNCFLLLTKIE